MSLSTFVDIFVIAFILIGLILGMKKGLIKSAVSFIGLLAIVILSYTFRYKIAEFLIDKMPFFEFSGFEGLTSLNILLYNVIAFVVIFIVLYCVLNIIITVTGFIDTLLKFTVIWVIPSKIGGAIIGALEAIAFVFIILFVLASFNGTSSMIRGSKAANYVLEKTPIMGNFLYGISTGARDIYNDIEKMRNDNLETKDINKSIMQMEISYGLITCEKAQELVDTGKVDLGDVTFSCPKGGN